MPEAVEENGMAGKSELEQLQFKANQVTDEVRLVFLKYFFKISKKYFFNP